MRLTSSSSIHRQQARCKMTKEENEKRYITVVFDQSKMTKEQDAAVWDVIKTSWANRTIAVMARGDCGLVDDEVQSD